MHIDTSAYDLSKREEHVRLDNTPDQCPRCHRAIHPKFLHAAKLQDRQLLQAVFRCTHQSCQELFIATYQPTGVHSGRPNHRLVGLAPIMARAETFPETVSAISPTFVDVYNQAIAAEASQLDQLVGIGLRKALEFLIKDYACSENSDKVVQIKSAQLAACINEYVTDANIKECARRAAWLGNDETHYVRKWDQKDVGDLKLLVKLTVNWIDNALLTRQYIEEMSAGKV